ncbi:MAG: ABC transporter permease [Devosia sp.]
MNATRPQSASLALGALLLTPVLLAAIAPGLLSPYEPTANVAPPLRPPSLTHLLGTDDLGRDVLSMVVHGARGALGLAAAVTVLAVGIGVAVGVVAGSFGAVVDEAAMRLTEFIKVLPNFLVALLVATLFGPSLLVLALVLGLLSWPGLARLVRAQTVVERHREHVLAARALGAHPVVVAWRHILPAAARPALAVIAPVATGGVLAEAGLGYLGLSDASAISWGDLIRNGQTFYAHGWWLSLFPGLAVVWTCVAIALGGEGLAHRRGLHR